MKFRHLTYLLLLLAVAIVANSCIYDRLDYSLDTYEEGLAANVELNISVPSMDVATRSDMPNDADFDVKSLWVGIFSATDGKCKYAKFHTELPPNKQHSFITLGINTTSGPSYIVAVGNPVDNYGYKYDETKDDGKVVRDDLTNILPSSAEKANEDGFDWEAYKNIAIRQLDLNDVNTPIGNLVMSGIYYNNESDPDSAADWEKANQKPVDIKVAKAGESVKLSGAVHLRRLISQVRFRIEAVPYTGSDGYKSASGNVILEIIPQSFQVKNVPYTSWLHERETNTTVGGDNKEANSGDNIYIDNAANGNPLGYDKSNKEMRLKANYRSSVWFNGSQYLIPHYKTDENGSQESNPAYYTFDFWMMENKRWASYDLYDNLGEKENAYDRREKEIKDSQMIEIENGEGGFDKIPYDENLGIYTALCWDGKKPTTVENVPETMNNCASFVEIRCRIIYTQDGLDAIQQDESKDYKDVEYRSADAVYTIHLGGVRKKKNTAGTEDWNDFTHRRNHIYTYNVKIMDVDRIIVEARYDDEPRPGIEGVVTDVVNPPFEVDCHYEHFNIQLCNLERTGGGIIQVEGGDVNTGGGADNDHEVNGGKYERGVFPFRIRYFDKNNFARYIDQGNIGEYMDPTDPDKNPLHWQWIEFRPTTGPDVIAEYKPYEGEGSDGQTFRINEVANIKKFRHFDDDENPDADDTTLRWYTVFVNEYVYETRLNEGENNFVNYVNLEPRMCWMNTLFRSSVDDESNYIRSKYVVRQQSIQTFYANIPHSSGNDENDFNAIGMEHINETFGFNLRWDGVPTELEGEDRTHNMQNNNGRHNTLLYIYDKGHQTRGELWTDYMDPTRLQFITGINTESNQYRVSSQLQEPPYMDEKNPKREPYYVPAIKTFPYRDIQDQTGFADPVDPRSNINTTHYLRILDACMNRNRDNNGNGKIDVDEIRWYVPASSEIVDLVLGHYSLRTPLLDYDKNYYLASPGSLQNPGWFQTEQNHQANTRFHYATSNQRVLWAEEGATINPEADVPTGTWNLPPQNLRCVRALGTDLETDENKDLTPAFTTNAKKTPNGYATEIYPTYYEQKNQRSYSSVALEPHQERTGDLNRVCVNGFEFKPELLHFKPVTIQVWVESGERTIPEGWYADDGEYLGIPEWKEGGGERYPGGMYLPDPKTWSDKQFPGSQKFDGFWIGGEDVGGCYYMPDLNDWGGDGQEPNKEGKYEWWDKEELPVESTKHEGAWYEPDLTQYAGDGQEPNKEGKYGWWKEEDLPDKSTMHEGAWYEPDVNKYGGAGQNPTTDGQYKWWDRFPDQQSTYHKSAYYEPDETQYKGSDRNNKPGDGYGWFEQFNIGGVEYGPGYYWPNVNDGPYDTAPNNDYAKIDEVFGDDYYGPGNYSVNTSNYSAEEKWGYAYFDQSFWYQNVQYQKGYYELIPGGDYWYGGPGFWVGEQHPAGYYGRDISRKIGNDNPPVNQLPWGYAPLPQYTTTLTIGGTTYQAGWYKATGEGTGDQWNPRPTGNYAWVDAWYDKYYDAGWYQPLESSKTNVGNPYNDPKNSNPNSIHQWFDTWYDKYYPSGWYQPLESSKTNVGNPNNNPKNSNPNSIHQWFDTWYDEYYRAGWYKPDLSKPAGDQWNSPNPMGTYKWFDKWHEGGTYYEEGYYGPDPTSRTTDGNNYWNADPRYKRFETFYELPAGYYGSDGSYLGPNRNSAPDPAWNDRNPRWVEEHTEPVPAGGTYEDKFVEGLWQDASGTTRDLFAYNEGNFVRDHGTTLLAANKICESEYGNGWRLPNMKEAALIKIAMDNAGIYKGQVDGGYLTHEVYHDDKSGYDVGNFIACTFREYGITGAQSRGEKTGYYTGIYYAEPGEAQAGDWSGDANNSPVLGRIACITTGWNRHFYIRCVRDLRSAGD